VTTTVLNPTLWLLAALIVRALVSWRRGEAASMAMRRFVTTFASRPVLVVLAIATAAALGSRAVVGYLSPGSYAEEVLAARAYLEARQLYQGNDRADFKKWLSEEPAPVAPWTLPGLTVCQANAAQFRPEFYTAQGHSPVLLMASVPLVAAAGGRALYVLLTLLSCAALGAMAVVLARLSGVDVRSPAGFLIVIALVGWQPTLAGLRQGDAVLIASGLLTAAWWYLRNDDPGRAGLAAAGGSLLLPPLSIVIPALGLASRRALGVAVGSVTAIAVLVVALVGPMIAVDYASSTLASARVYAASPMSYSGVGQFLRLGAENIAPAAWASVGLVTLSAAATLLSKAGPPATARIDLTLALLLTTAFLLVPVAWSQHVTLLVIPIAVLLRRTIASEHPATLVALAALVLVLSLPDQAVGRLGLLLHLSGGPLGVTGVPPVPVCAAVTLWGWMLVANLRAVPAPRTPALRVGLAS
jgi:hypothetical protein